MLRLRIRRPDADRERFLPDMKFAVVQGSFMGPLLLNANNTKACVVIESELDAMATAWAAKCAELPVAALAVGTNLGKPDAAAHAFLQQCLGILVALDFDQPDAKGNRPGAQGFSWWRKQYREAERWPVPQGKDPGEAAATVDLAAWMRAGLPPVLRRKPQSVPSLHRTRPAEAPAAAQSPAVMPAKPLSADFSRPVVPCGDGLLSQGEGKTTKSGQPRQPWEWLKAQPATPKTALGMLRRAGLCVEATNNDFVIHGHDSWPHKEFAYLFTWLKSHGYMVRMALHGPQLAGARVSPQSGNSTERPDAATSDQEYSQPSYGALGTGEQ